MQFMNIAFGNGTIAFDELKKALQHRGVVLNNSGNQLWQFLTGLERNKIGANASLDQGLRDAFVNVVHTLDLPGFNGPFTREALREVRQKIALLQFFLLIFPALQKRAEFSASERTPILRQVRDGLPD